MSNGLILEIEVVASTLTVPGGKMVVGPGKVYLEPRNLALVMAEATSVLDQLQACTDGCESDKHAEQLLLYGWCRSCQVKICVLRWWL